MTLEQALHKYDALSMRERLLIIASVAVVTFMLCSALLWAPMDKAQAEYATELKTIEMDLQTQQGLKTVYEQGLTKDPDVDKKRQLEALKELLASLDQSLTKLSVGLVPAAKLPVLLQDVLKHSEQLTLLKVETLPIAEMSLQGGVIQTSVDETAVDELGRAAEHTAGVFKHSVRVTIEGRFFQVLSYLKALEQLSWRLFWEQLVYSVSDYPEARVQFVVYTLSTEEGLFSAK